MAKLIFRMFFLAGCSGFPGNEYVNYKMNMEKWKEHHPLEFSYHFQKFGSFHPSELEPVKVLFNSEGYHFSFLNNTPYEMNEVIKNEVQIEKLFGYISKAIMVNVHIVNVDYDPKYGFPKKIYVDWNDDVLHDEQSIIISSFEINNSN